MRLSIATFQRGDSWWLTAALTVCMCAGCSTREAQFHTTNNPSAQSSGQQLHQNTSSDGATNGPVSQTNRTELPPRLYTKATNEQLSPVSSNSISRLYVEATNGPTAAQPIPTGGTNSALAMIAAQDDGKSDSDKLIIRQIRLQLAGDITLGPDGTRLKIKASDGSVTITGALQTEKEKDLLGNLVRSVAGVSAFDDQTSVKPGQ